MALGDMFNKAKDTAVNLKNNVSEQTNKLIEENQFLSDIKDIGINKINEVFSELDASTTIIKEAGYELSTIDVEIGFPSGVTPHFLLISNISDERKTELLEFTQGKKVLSLVLPILFKISDIQKKVLLQQYKFCEVAITIGVPPKVNVTFKDSGGNL